MTDDMERYYYLKDGNWEQISDESTTNNFYTLEQCANELNRLNEENEQLKQEMGDLGTVHAEEINKIEDDFDEELLKLEKENGQLKKQMQRLYNYFVDWHGDIMGANQFSEMWDDVKEDEDWDD